MPILSFHRDHGATAAFRAAQPARGEKVLADATDDNTGATVLATSYRIVAVRDGAVTLDRAWSQVDSGHFDPDTWTLTLTWVDRARPVQFTFRGQASSLPEVVHERVQASVVLAESLGLTGPRRNGRVVIRKDLRTRDLSVQTVLGRGTPADDPEVRAAIARVTAQLKDRVGL